MRWDGIIPTHLSHPKLHAPPSEGTLKIEIVVSTQGRGGGGVHSGGLEKSIITQFVFGANH